MIQTTGVGLFLQNRGHHVSIQIILMFIKLSGSEVKWLQSMRQTMLKGCCLNKVCMFNMFICIKSQIHLKSKIGYI